MYYNGRCILLILISIFVSFLLNTMQNDIPPKVGIERIQSLNPRFLPSGFFSLLPSLLWLDPLPLQMDYGFVGVFLVRKLVASLV